jgi:hypothetical protein
LISSAGLDFINNVFSRKIFVVERKNQGEVEMSRLIALTLISMLKKNFFFFSVAEKIK